MNKKNSLGELRKHLLKMRGGKLISAEAYILAMIAFCVLSIEYNDDISQWLAFGVAIIIAFVFPVIVGLIKTLAWLVAIIFSLMWALFAGILGWGFSNESVTVGLLVALICFVVSFFIHKNYSGLTFHGMGRRYIHKKQAIVMDEPKYERIQFCPTCGRKLSDNGICDYCDR